MLWAEVVYLELLLISTVLIRDIYALGVAFLVIGERSSYSSLKSKRLKDSILEQSKNLGLQNYVEIFVSSDDFRNVVGGWAVWPLLGRLVAIVESQRKGIDWLIICEDTTVVNVEKLFRWLEDRDFNRKAYFGHPLYDRSSTIIHHYAFAGEDPTRFLYPDFAGGIAMLLWDNGRGVNLTSASEFCAVETDSRLGCISYFSPNFNGQCSNERVKIDEILFAVKTYQQHHKTRVVVLKRTWGKDALNIEFYSDREDLYIPTVNLGIENTERGHCGKTEAILHRSLEEQWKKIKWLVIADDDTLLSVARLKALLECYNHKDIIILGERYGYGFSIDGETGYEYPTGGSGMIFSRLAVEQLAKHCKCPSIDSPDDMILGMCAHRLGIPVLHSAALHQARPEDYAEDYLKRLPSISFHRHWEVDPYKVYTDWLNDSSNIKNRENRHSHDHSEL